MASAIKTSKSTPFQMDADEARFVLLQRTAYQSLLTKLFSRLGPRTKSMAIRSEAILRARTIADLYEQEMISEFAEIRGALGQVPRSVLDIGCGLAGIHVVAHKAWSKYLRALVLYDKSEDAGTIYYDFHDVAAFYNSMSHARKFLINNGVAGEIIFFEEARENFLPSSEAPYDLIMSLISWGFHYPVETYLREAKPLLSEEGALVLDVRKTTNGLEVLRQHFEHVEVVSEYSKRLRIIARRAKLSEASLSIDSSIASKPQSSRSTR